MTYAQGPQLEGTTQGLPWKVVGPAGSDYPITAYSNSFGTALQQAITDAGTATAPKFAILIGPGSWTIDQQIVFKSPGQVIHGSGIFVTTLKPGATLGVDAFSTLAQISPIYMDIGDFGFDGTLVSSGVAGATTVTITAGSTFVYTHGNASGTGWTTTAATTAAYVKFGISGVTFTTGVGNCDLNGHSLGTTSGKVANTLNAGSGLFMNIGDVLTITWTVGTPTMTWQQNNGWMNFTSLAYVQGAEAAAPVLLSRIRTANGTNIGSLGFNGFIFDGCEDSLVLFVKQTGSNGGFQANLNNGTMAIVSSKFNYLSVGSVSFDYVDSYVLSQGFIYSNGGPPSAQNLNFVGGGFNGVTGSTCDLVFNNLAAQPLQVTFEGGQINGGAAGVSAATFMSGAGLAFTTFSMLGPTFNGASLAAHSAIFGTAPAAVSGNICVPSNANFTNADLVAGITTGAYVVNRAGVITGYVGIVPLTGYNLGNGAVVAATLQKSETGADASLLSYTPPSVAGMYRVHFAHSVKTATAAVIGWTVTYTDAEGNAQAPTNLDISESGAAATAKTITTSAAANAQDFYGDTVITTDNSGTAIVVKTTSSGTLTASLASAFIERII